MNEWMVHRLTKWAKEQILNKENMFQLWSEATHIFIDEVEAILLK